jgi:radical SAM protein (TIGR01212 family)
MDMEPYYPISQLYKKRFGEKIYKIPVAIVDDCPNRRGLKGMETCIFCDVHGSAARVEAFEMDLREQIEEFMKRIGDMYNAKSFVVYFQAYTNTFAKLSALKEYFDIALSYPQVKGFVVGTRPDCLSPAVMRTWQEYAEKCYVAVELGVQSFYDRDLEFIKRGHDSECSIKAIYKIRENCPDVQLGVHFMLGMPGETQEECARQAEICSHLPIDDVKLHNLHVLENTPLAKLYREGTFTPVDFEEYCDKVGAFISNLSPELAVHRLAALSTRKEELIAPDWTANKMKTFQGIKSYLENTEQTQGSKVNNTDLWPMERTLATMSYYQMIQAPNESEIELR